MELEIDHNRHHDRNGNIAFFCGSEQVLCYGLECFFVEFLVGASHDSHRQWLPLGIDHKTNETGAFDAS